MWVGFWSLSFGSGRGEMGEFSFGRNGEAELLVI